jgi:Domain of unknown function (DUF5911)
MAWQATSANQVGRLGRRVARRGRLRGRAAPGTGPVSRSDGSAYPAIADYVLISDRHSVALVSSRGSIDWCCLPRVDAGKVFGRLLECERGGYCSVVSYSTLRRTFTGR